ncbi:MAG: hypothetical protein KDA85_22415, partial [Planctomycetaceae bacterium]|nr:hypothetical protein [Planctomycetaceae bacterium]
KSIFSRYDATSLFGLDLATGVAQRLGEVGARELESSALLDGWRYFASRGALYATDGHRPARRILDWNLSGGARLSVMSLTVFRGSLLILAEDYASGSVAKLYQSDGTVVGTKLVTEIPDSAFSVGNFVGVTQSDDRLFFTMEFKRVWVTDGTAAGTRHIATVNGLIQLLAVAGNNIYYSDRINGMPLLWTSNGTPEGTHLVADPESGEPLRLSSELLKGDGLWVPFAAAADQLFFVRDDEVWVTNGTTAGTHRVLESAQVRNLIAVHEGAVAAAFPESETSGSTNLWWLDAHRDPELLVNANQISAGRVYTNFPLFEWRSDIVYLGDEGWTNFEPWFISKHLPPAPPVGLRAITRNGRRIQWESVFGANDYSIQIEEEATGRIITDEVVTSAEFLDTSMLADGTYRARVRAIGDAQSVSAWTAWVPFLVGDVPEFIGIPSATSNSVRSYAWLTPPDTVVSELWISNLDTRTVVYHHDNIHSSSLTRSSAFLAESLPPARYAMWV